MPTAYTFKHLDAEEKKEIVELVKETLRKEELAIVKSSNDKRRGNVKLLLRKYRDISLHADEALYDANDSSITFTPDGEEYYTLADILDPLNSGKRIDFKIASTMRSAIRSGMLVEHMNRMIEAYRVMCEKSGNPEDLRRYRVLYNMYFDPDREPTAEEIADEEHIGKSSVYNDINKAVEALSVLIFGVDGIPFS
jgi:predicted DNA binding protein